MERSRLLDELHRHQAAILAHLDTTDPILAGPAEAARAALSRQRWALVRLLRGYQLFKHGELFDPLIRRGTAVDRIAATRMKAACVALGELFAAHVRRWSTADTAARWPECRAETMAMHARLRFHIARERQESMQLLGTASSHRRVA